jgi:hypothetical protein
MIQVSARPHLKNKQELMLHLRHVSYVESINRRIIIQAGQSKKEEFYLKNNQKQKKGQNDKAPA